MKKVEVELKALLEDSSILKLRNFIANQINSGEVTGDEIYQYLFDFVDKGLLSEEVEEKANDLMDALSGWCAKECWLGTGNYGRQFTSTVDCGTTLAMAEAKAESIK